LLWLLETAGGLVGTLLLVLLLVTLRLEFGPIEVDFLTPALVSYLNTEAAPLSVQIDRTSLEWSVGRSTIEVVGSSLRIEDPVGRQMLSIPKLSLSVSLRALLAGRVALSRVTVTGPELDLVRSESGGIDLNLGAAGAGPADAEPGTAGADGAVAVGAGAAQPELDMAPPTLQALWEGFAGKPSTDRALSLLDSISIVGADVTIDDRRLGLRWHVGDGEIDFSRRTNGLEAELSGLLALGTDKTVVTGHLHYDDPARRLGFALGWGAFELSHLSAVLPPAVAARVAGVELPVAGEVQGAVSLADGKPGPIHIHLDSGAGTLVDPFFAGGKLALDGVKLEADYAPAAEQVKLDRLLVDLGGPTIEIEGVVEHVPPDLVPRSMGMPLPVMPMSGSETPETAVPATAAPLPNMTLPMMTAGASILIRNMPIDRLPGYWPPGVGDHTRSWVTTNLSAGRIEEMRTAVSLDLAPGTDKPVDATSFVATMSIKGASIDYLHGLPRVEGADATATLLPKKLEFDFTAGHLKGLAMSGGSVVIDQLDQPYERCTIDLALSGPAEDVIAVLDMKPLQYSRPLGLDPKRTSGMVDGTLHFRLPLRNALPISDIEYGATAQLTNLAIGQAALGQDLTDGTFALKLDSDAVTLDGMASLGSTPGKISFKEHLSSAAPGPRVETHLEAVLDDAARQRFGFAILPDNIQGPIASTLTYTEFAGRRAHLVAALDLADTTMALDQLGWDKAPGQPAHADFAVDFADGKPTRLTDLVVRAPKLELKGEIGFAADGGFSALQTTKFRLGETDAALSVARAGTGWKIGLHGDAIDLTEPLKQLKAKSDVKREDAGSKDGGHADPGPTVALDLAADRIILGPDQILQHAIATGTIANHTLAEGRLSAGFGKSGKVEFRLDTIEAGGGFSLATDDLGGLLAIGNISDNVEGGHLTISGHALREGKGRRFSGRAEGGDYRVVGAPFLLRLASIASFDSIITLLNGQGVPFSTLKADMSLYDGKLDLAHARIYGGALAVNVDGQLDLDAGTLNLKGTLVPAYALNSILDNVPILGDLLMGGEGQGMFAATFSLGGRIEAPIIKVNPLSPLAPGFLRRLFLFDAPEPAPQESKK
jgi:Protein of unknown function/AsmA-like C-terminal region